METPMFTIGRNIARLTVLNFAIGYCALASAGPTESIFGDAYRPVEGVVATQAQVVLFRAMGQGGQGAHVYVDGEMESSLMPGGYTVFCLPAGQHTVETYIGDAPKYEGKRARATYAQFKGGENYFLQVAPDSKENVPAVLSPRHAEQQLKEMRLQTHVLNRASAVVPCQTESHLSLRSDVLFSFGKSGYSDITSAGHEELRKIAQSLKSQKVDSVTVAGHADPIGDAASNQRLSEARAQTVTSVLLQLGIGTDSIHSVGYGSTQTVVSCTTGSRRELIACNAPNRRVDLTIRGRSAE